MKALRHNIKTPGSVAGRTERTSWHVEWRGVDGLPCTVTSHVSAERAKRLAANYFSNYSRATVYRLIKVVERRTTLERFKASAPNK